MTRKDIPSAKEDIRSAKLAESRLPHCDRAHSAVWFQGLSQPDFQKSVVEEQSAA
jgi:hypothetical protein